MKRRFPLWLVILIGVSLLLLIPVRSRAHEIFYDSAIGSPIPLKWSITSSGRAYLAINGDYLSSNWAAYYPDARAAWNNTADKVITGQSPFSSSTVDLATPTPSSWSNIVGSSNIYLVLGICQPKATNGVVIKDLASAKNSSGLISYTSVYLTPYNNEYPNNTAGQTYRKNTMAHEIGHALALGHPDRTFYSPIPSGTSSLMRSVGPQYFYTPSAHDRTDIDIKYWR